MFDRSGFSAEGALTSTCAASHRDSERDSESERERERERNRDRERQRERIMMTMMDFNTFSHGSQAAASG